MDFMDRQCVDWCSESRRLHNKHRNARCEHGDCRDCHNNPSQA